MIPSVSTPYVRRSLRSKIKNVLCEHQARPSACPSVTSCLCPIFMKFGIAFIYKTLLSRREFRENWRSGSHALRKGTSALIYKFLDRSVKL